ncbi:MAG: NIPSNAP family protein [Bacteroidota bacterium]
MLYSQLLRLLSLLIALVGFSMLAGCSHDHPHEADHDHATNGKEYYELREYSVSSAEQQQQVLAYLRDAAVPGLNRQGISPVGVFTPTAPDSGLTIYMLIPYQSLDQFADAPAKLMADAAHNQAGAAYLDLSDPEMKAYDRIDSRLLVAFDSMPKMEVPALKSNPNRVFELRSYESFSEKKGLKKIKMFNVGNEVTIFKNLGFQPVFFAQAITGDELPNLIYMVTYSSMEDHPNKWKSFANDPGWKAVKGLEEYKNTVSKIHKYFLAPTDFSQL